MDKLTLEGKTIMAEGIIGKVVSIVGTLVPEVKTADEWKKLPKETILPILTPLHIPMVQSIGLVYGHKIDVDTAKLLHSVFSKEHSRWLDSGFSSLMNMALDAPIDSIPFLIAGAISLYNINFQYKGAGIACRVATKITEGIGKSAIDYFKKIPEGMLGESPAPQTSQKLDKEPIQLEIRKEVELLELSPVSNISQIAAYKQKKKHREQAEEEEKQAAQDVEKLVSICGADTEGISTLYEIWQLEIEDNKAVRGRLKELYKDRMPEDATPRFYVQTKRKEIKSGEKREYKYLEVIWSRTVGRDEDGDFITEEGHIHLGSLSEFTSWTHALKTNQQNAAKIEKS